MIKKFILILFAMFCAGRASAANVVVLDGNESVRISETTILENNGNFNADIYVDSICDVYIKNNGMFNANVHLAPGAELVHIISGVADAKPIDVNTSYSIKIENATDVPFDVISDSVANVDRIIIKNSSFVISDAVLTHNVPVEIVGHVNLLVDDINDVKDGPILRNAIGNGSVHVMVNNADNRYVYNTYMAGSWLMVDVPRETDDDKVLGDSPVGDFVEDLRGEDNNDSILDDLDSGANIDKVLAKSARFNPRVLLRPVRVMSVLNMNAGVENVSGVSARPWGIFSSDFDMYGGEVGFVARITDDLVVNLGARIGKLEYASGLDEFNATIYGANMSAEYMLTDSLFLDLKSGLFLMRSDIGDVLYDGKVFHNPNSLSGYGALDVGYKFTNDSGMYVAPVVGVATEYYQVENFDKFDYAIRAGFGAGYTSEIFGVKYNYDINLSAGTNDYLYAGLRAGVLVPMDMVGGDINIGVVRMFDTITYTISATAKLLF